MSAHSRTQFNRPGDIPPLRRNPFEPDGHDELRAEYAIDLWDSQTNLLRQRDRQVEENLRMLIGQHWIAWSEMRGRFIDLSEHLSSDEKRWRHMPVLNRLFVWYVLHHARMTENPPIIGWQAGPDRIDAQLAEVMDVVFKYLYRETGMVEVLDRMFMWMIPSGRAFLKSRIDRMAGEPIASRGTETLSLLGPDGQPTISRELDNVPFGPDGQPLAKLGPDGEPVGMDAQPHIFYEGGIKVDLLTCLEVRGEWGGRPWHDKSWHIHKSLLTPLQAYEEYGIELEPDVRGEQAESVGALYRILHGSGLFGAAEARTTHSTQAGREFVSIYELWQRPSRTPGMQRTQESPGGRLMIVTGDKKVIRDGPRFAPFRHTSPIRCFDNKKLPGRPQGTSDMEFLNGPIRTRNRLYAQEINHATMSANPVRILDSSQGMELGKVPNVPGAEILADRSKSTALPLEYSAPGQLSPDVYRARESLTREIDEIGSIAGTSGETPTEDASGELVKELRFNSDRPIASTMRGVVFELGRMAEDWQVMVPVIWDQEKILSIMGEDNIARTVTVWPDLFKQGSVNVEPSIESMLPEGRGERQQRVHMLWAEGFFGDPQSPQAINAFFENVRFPHISRYTRPGGIDRTTAQQRVGQLLQGATAEELPIFEWYDHEVHLHVLESFMKSPEYLKADPPVQQEMVVYREMLFEAAQYAAAKLIGRQMALELSTQASAGAATQAVAGAVGGEPADGSETPPEGTASSDTLPRTQESVA